VIKYDFYFGLPRIYHLRSSRSGLTRNENLPSSNPRIKYESYDFGLHGIWSIRLESSLFLRSYSDVILEDKKR
jgi:hypothetical protein